MKKFIFAFFVVLATTLSFSSCADEELSDGELYTNILVNGEYSDKDVADLDELTFVGNTVTWVYDGSVLLTGTWNVVDGKVVITESDASVTYLKISDEGDKLTSTEIFPTYFVKK